MSAFVFPNMDEKDPEDQKRIREIEKSIRSRRFHKKLFSRFAKAINTYDLLQPGDRVAVCISGGKDSMLMAKLFQELKRHNKFDFSLVFLVMDPGYSPANRRRIEENARFLGIPITIFETEIFESVTHVEKNPCYLCARMRRGYLYSRARELGCNKIALGHHYDDVIETILMGMLYGAQIQTMMPKLHSSNFSGLDLIRPMYLVREEDIIAWARANDLHFLRCACRFTEAVAKLEDRGEGSGPSKRLEIKELIASLKETNPFVEGNIFKSVENVNLNTIVAWKQDGVRHHFLEDYNKADPVHMVSGPTGIKGDPDDFQKLLDRFFARERLNQADYLRLLLAGEDPESGESLRQILREEAVRLRKEHCGERVFLRGLVEFSNYCRNNCYYCGIRRDNAHCRRFRLSSEDILACCREGYRLGYRTFVLQSGEDPWFQDERMVPLVEAIRKEFPDCAITLSLGERSKTSFRRLYDAGADRYLLRHETASLLHYQFLHPASMSLENRMACLRDLKEIGYQIGAGMMVGSPGQTLSHLAEDLCYLQELAPHMVGMGPFIPHHDTPFGGEAPGSVRTSLLLLSIIRIMLPDVLLPATTALQSLDPRGWEKGLDAGANVIMPNLSPEQSRADYDLYDHKNPGKGRNAQEIEELRTRVEAMGLMLDPGRGDSVRMHPRGNRSPVSSHIGTDVIS